MQNGRNHHIPVLKRVVGVAEIATKASARASGPVSETYNETLMFEYIVEFRGCMMYRCV